MRVVRLRSAVAGSRWAKRESAGGPSSRRYFPESSPFASGEYGMKATPRSRHAGSSSPSGRARRMLSSPCRLAYGRSPWVAASLRGLAELLGAEVRAPDLADLAGGDERVEGAQRLLRRYRRVGVVDLVEIDAIGAEPTQALLDTELDRSPAGADALVHRRVARWTVAVHPVQPGAAPAADLGGDHDVVAPAGQGPAEEDLGLAVDVSGVEQRDPGIERGVHDVTRRRLVHRRPEPRPERVAAETDDRDLERADRAGLHDVTAIPSG